MKILALHGSPRYQGNSSQLLNAFLEEAQSLGASVDSYVLNSMRMKGCQACYMCRQPGQEKQCAMNDDMSVVLDDLFAANLVVLASPVYMWQMSAQAKLFVDRLMPVHKPDFTSWLDGQQLLSIYTQGQPDVTRFASYFTYVNDMFGFLGFRTTEPLVFGGLRQAGDVQQHPEYLERVRECARNLVQGA